MLAVEMLPAGHGDALVVEYGSGSRMHRLLIDAGTVHSYDDVRARLLERDDSKYEAFVITHVDEDHIGGAIPLLADPDLRHRIDHIWFNGYVHSKRGGDVLGPIDGERLTRAITDGGYQWNAPFGDRVSPAVGGPIVVPSTGDLPCFSLAGGAFVYLLSPSGKKLKRMASQWEKTVIRAGLVPGVGTDRDGRAPKPRGKDVAELPEVLSAAEIEELVKPTDSDSSAANGSSIAFILEFENSRVLLAGDAHPATLVEALSRFARMKDESRVRLDICKLPHHGSRANVTTALVNAIDASRYLISTDGMTFGHPNDAALARIIRTSASPAEIYCNYASARTLGWVPRAAALGATVYVPEKGDTSMRVEVG
ncbi:MAG: ComEC/Rec2 family competence protein [Pseudomarimonas sp.]